MVGNELWVWLHTNQVAILSAAPSGELRLRYTEQILAERGAGALLLSAALPVNPKGYSGAAVANWTETLLPEGETRTLLEDRFEVRRGDVFGLLAAIGADCAGAVSLLEPGRVPLVDSTQVESLSETELARAVDALPSNPLGVDDEVRVSLGGLQSKLLLTRLGDGSFGLPVAGTPSTHILKPDPLRYPGLIAAEAFTLRLAHEAGIEAADAKLLKVGGRSALLLARYDRSLTDGLVRRLHQEDGLSALGLDPRANRGQMKHQSLSPDGPTLARLADLLRRHGENPRTGLALLARQVVLRTAVGDTDGHARNYSFLMEAGRLRVAPLYDAAPTRQFVPAKTVALWVGGQSVLSAIRRGHLIAEFESWRMPSRVVHPLVDDTLERLADAVPRAADAVREAAPEVVDSVARRVAAMQRSSVKPPS